MDETGMNSVAPSTRASRTAFPMLTGSIVEPRAAGARRPEPGASRTVQRMCPEASPIRVDERLPEPAARVNGPATIGQ